MDEWIPNREMFGKPVDPSDEGYFPKPMNVSEEYWEVLKQKFLEGKANWEGTGIFASTVAEAHQIDYAQFTAHFTRPN